MRDRFCEIAYPAVSTIALSKKPGHAVPAVSFTTALGLGQMRFILSLPRISDSSLLNSLERSTSTVLS